MGTANYKGKGFKERTGVSGERPRGATSFRKQSTQKLYQTPCTPVRLHVCLSCAQSWFVACLGGCCSRVTCTPPTFPCPRTVPPIACNLQGTFCGTSK